MLEDVVVLVDEDGVRDGYDGWWQQSSGGRSGWQRQPGGAAGGAGWPGAATGGRRGWRRPAGARGWVGAAGESEIVRPNLGFGWACINTNY